MARALMRLGAGLAAASTAFACVTSSRRTVEDAPPAVLRRVIADPESLPNDRDAARERLAALEWDAVRATPSILAAKRWLDEFRGTPHVGEAEQLLETLRFQAAESAPNWEEALRDHLREHPKGAYAARARERLGAAELERALASPNPEALQRWLRAYPDHPDAEARARAEAALEERLFARAREGGEAALDHYLGERPGAPHAAEARALRDGLARESAARLALAAAEEALDPDALDAVAREHAASSAAAEASSRARALRAHPRAKKLRELAGYAAPGSGAREVDALRQDLGSDDPVTRRLAVAELRLRPEGPALDAALQAFDSLDPDVRYEAVLTVEGIFRAWPEERRGKELRAREAKLLPVARAGPTLARLAALRSASADAGALDTWRAVLASDAQDPVAAVMVARLEQGFPSRPVAWRRAAKVAAELASAREGRARCPALFLLDLAARSLDAVGLEGRDRADVEGWREGAQKDAARLAWTCPPRLGLQELLHEVAIGQRRALEQLAAEGEVAAPALRRASRAGLAMECAAKLLAGAKKCDAP